MPVKFIALREHEFCYGHRVVGHESKCKNLHGHNATVKFGVRPLSTSLALDSVGRVIDFSVIKERLCEWLEDNWDHKMLMWNQDPFLDERESDIPLEDEKKMGIVRVPFNPTAENMANYLLTVVGPKVLYDLPVELVSVEFHETSKCSVLVTKE